MEEQLQDLLNVNLEHLYKYSEAINEFKVEKDRELQEYIKEDGDITEEKLDWYYTSQSVNSLLLKDMNHYYSIVYNMLNLFKVLEIELREDNKEIMLQLDTKVAEILKTTYTPSLVINKEGEIVENIQGSIEKQKELLQVIIRDSSSSGQATS